VSENVIKLLPDHVANKIAAGEVVERPASVIKECIENAIDAGAKHISVEVVVGGRKSIVISDDGKGMSRDDALMSVERHATSKIREVDDIELVGTLGFRGEALAAISSVSQFIITTRREEDEVGTELQIAGSTIQDVRDVGCPKGSTIKVRNLFYNVPARKKFLKAEQTEMYHIKRMFQVYTLLHHDIGWKLISDERELVNLPPVESLLDRLHDLYSKEWVRDLRPVSIQRGGMEITGYAGLPTLTRNDRNEQHMFINQRPASAPVIMRAITEGYHGMMQRDKQPVLFMFINLDPGMVDVNVHPTKKEVRFRNASAVRDLVIAAIQQALTQKAENPEADRELRNDLMSRMVAPASSSKGFPPPSVKKSAPVQYPQSPLVSQDEFQSSDVTSADKGAKNAEVGSAPWKWCKVLDQSKGGVILLETDDGIVLLEPRAAQERVLYERIMSDSNANKVSSQRLLQAETVDIPADLFEEFEQSFEQLEKLGFEVSAFGDASVIVEALPASIGDISAKGLIEEMAEAIKNAGVGKGSSRVLNESLAKSICRAVARQRNHLNTSEMEMLVTDLSKTKMPYTCPQGRPTMIFMGYQELKRKFGR